MANRPARIIWHHTAVAGLGSQLAGVDKTHKERGYPVSRLGYYVGYHILIEKTGTVRRCREDDEIGAHAYGNNQDTLGVCLAGNFNTEQPTQEQINSLRYVLQSWMLSWNIPKEQIVPHRAVRQTECPGSGLPDEWAQSLVDESPQQKAINNVIALLKEAITQLQNAR